MLSWLMKARKDLVRANQMIFEDEEPMVCERQKCCKNPKCKLNKNSETTKDKQ